MSVLCVIPARGGSKGVKRKNLRKIGGRTLVSRAVDSALASTSVDSVVVSTDDDEIAAEAQRCGAEVVRRPADLGSDSASSESVLLHALGHAREQTGRAVDVLVFLQCTSPVIESADIDRAVAMVRDEGFDAVFSAVPSHGFIWQRLDGSAVGVNHDSRIRERRQDRPSEFLETGAIYVMDAAGFIEAGHRFFGRIGICEVSRDHAIEIDEEADLDLARFVADRSDAGPLVRLDPAKVAALVTDFDGVHTDNRATVDQTGVESVSVNRSDGMGLAALRATGLPILILSTEKNPVVAARAHKLGIECIHGSDDKLAALEGWAALNSISLDETVYIGNDTNDVACLTRVGWPIVVADAHSDVLGTGAMVTSRPGGMGAVREVTDHLLSAGTASQNNSRS